MSIVFLGVVLIVIAGVFLAFFALTRTRSDVDRSSQTTANLAKVQAALEHFAGTAERLPCPANPALDTGDAEPTAAAANCTFPEGTVPWRTIGLPREASLDAWGWKISYRAYQGARGLTQTGGASMVHCDIVEPVLINPPPANGVCPVTHNMRDTQFIAGKGLAVSSFGTSVTDAAYVLISHGPSGLGAYTTSNSQKLPNPANADELANLGAAGPFIGKAPVTNVASEDATFFDDVMAYRRLADFVKQANLGARDWPETGGTLADITFNQTTVQATTGTTVAPGSSTGRQSLNFSNASVTAFDSTGEQNISFDTTGGYPGIGGMGGGTMISSAASEGLRIDLAVKARQIGLTLANFEQRPGNVEEQVELKFYDGATVVNTIIAKGCKVNADIATFSYAVPADFNRVEIRALAATDNSETAFLFAELLTCGSSGICRTPLWSASSSCP